MKRVSLGPVVSGPSSQSRRHVSHRRHQAEKLRRLANKCDQQIIKLLNRKKKLLDMAAKLESSEQVPTGVDMPEWNVGSGD